MHKIALSLLLLIGQTVSASLLDKTLAVVNDQIITMSDANRTKKTLSARRNISPFIYKQKSYTTKEIVTLLVQRILIRQKLTEINIIIGDEQVESQIKANEKRLGISRTALMSFLQSNGLSFEEYFETVRESLEFSYFNSRVVSPLISITEQEIKNKYYQENINNKTLSFKYSLVDFTLPAKAVSKKMKKNLPNVLKKFQITGNLPKSYSDIETNELGDVSEDGLTKKLKQLLKRTDEGSFSKAITMNGLVHIFYIKKKDLQESEAFLKVKNRIREKLYEKNAKSISSLWYEREENKHYVKYFIN